MGNDTSPAIAGQHNFIVHFADGSKIQAVAPDLVRAVINAVAAADLLRSCPLLGGVYPGVGIWRVQAVQHVCCPTAEEVAGG